MAGSFPSRRVLGLPAWLWVVLPIPLLALGNMLSSFWLPSKLAEPPPRAEVFREPVLVARDGASFRFVPFGQHKEVKPLWAVNVIVQDMGTVRWESHFFVPGLFLKESRWTYELTSHRFDDDWKGDKENPFMLPAEEVRQLRPLVINELNQRQPSAKLGDRLEGMLTTGLEERSYLCPQNAVVVLAWLSLPMAVVGLCLMFVRPRSHPVAARGSAEPNAAADGGRDPGFR